MKITAVNVTHVDQCLWGSFERQFEIKFVNPMQAYPRFGWKDWFWDRRVSVVEIETDEGYSGIGWCEDGCAAVPPIINNHLKKLVVGEDPFDYEGIWDRMYRSSIPYGRKGAALEAIAAIDIAIWDVMGKATGKSVSALLGGGAVKQVPTYASGLHPVSEDKVAAEAADYVAQGYPAMKCRFQFGPYDGAKGLAANVEHVRTIREAAGDDVMIMGDAYMGWNLAYAIEFCRKAEKYKLSWLEEPFIPDDLTSYARLCKETNIPIAGGEHEFTHYGFAQIIEKEAMHILQPDLHRCGGITEGRRIANLASSYGLTVNPHAFSSVHVHFVAAMPNAHFVEHFPVPVWERDLWRNEKPLIAGEPAFGNGGFEVPQTPGLGITVDWDSVTHNKKKQPVLQ
ncbi:MAG TPA: enolase C-terminal domain-like protein [Chitinophagaceae bacterium]|nr:enolase C-terminal domain-like protein [Chitinophagaceae bacterium]